MKLRTQQICARAFILPLLAWFAGPMNAAVLNPETVNAWTAYVQAAQTRFEDRLHGARLHTEAPFLVLDEDEAVYNRVRAGEVFVSPVGQTPRKAPNGLIHDWMGAAFLPNEKLDDILRTVRNYDYYKLFYAPAVINSKTLVKDGLQDRFSMLLSNKSLVAKTALDSDYESSFFRVDSHRWYSISKTTRIQEIEKYGTPNQRLLPEDEGTGLIWRLFSITLFEERDGGVYIELEVIVLSRDVPRALRWAITPIIRRVSKDSLVTSLRQTESAVHFGGSSPDQPSVAPSNSVRSFH